MLTAPSARLQVRNVWGYLSIAFGCGIVVGGVLGYGLNLAELIFGDGERH